MQAPDGRADEEDLVNRGYSSVSSMYESAARFKEAQGEGRELHVLYFGDHDPSGEDMVRDVRDRLALFGVEDLDVTKVAIKGEDIARYHLPPQPVKDTDARAGSFREAHGDECVEIDALPLPVLKKRITDAIKRFLNLKKYRAVIDKEQRQREAVRVDFEAEEG